MSLQCHLAMHAIASSVNLICLLKPSADSGITTSPISRTRVRHVFVLCVESRAIDTGLWPETSFPENVRQTCL